MVVEKGGKRCVLDPSTREFPISDLNGVEYGQFGQRVHVAPETSEGLAHMRSPEDGWCKAPREEGGFAWGRGLSGGGRDD
eukprot:1459518-Karenia_brevis.AAC.1